MAAGAVAATTVGVAVTDNSRGTTAAGGPAAPQTTEAGPAVSCVVALPDDPAAVRIRVVDGGSPTGSPAAVASQLRARRFTVLPDTTGTVGDGGGGAATLRYGPPAIGAAALLKAELHGHVTMRFDPARRDDTIDVILGWTFTRLATMTEVNQALAAAGEPTAPPRCSTPGR
jgi:hypothetical protein